MADKHMEQNTGAVTREIEQTTGQVAGTQVQDMEPMAVLKTQSSESTEILESDDTTAKDEELFKNRENAAKTKSNVDSNQLVGTYATAITDIEAESDSTRVLPYPPVCSPSDSSDEFYPAEDGGFSNTDDTEIIKDEVIQVDNKEMQKMQMQKTETSLDAAVDEAEIKKDEKLITAASKKTDDSPSTGHGLQCQGKNKPRIGPFPFSIKDSLQHLPVLKSPADLLKQRQKLMSSSGAVTNPAVTQLKGSAESVKTESTIEPTSSNQSDLKSKDCGSEIKKDEKLITAANKKTDDSPSTGHGVQCQDKNKPIIGPFPFSIKDSLQHLPVLKSPADLLKQRQKLMSSSGAVTNPAVTQLKGSAESVKTESTIEPTSSNQSDLKSKDSESSTPVQDSIANGKSEEPKERKVIWVLGPEHRVPAGVSMEHFLTGRLNKAQEHQSPQTCINSQSKGEQDKDADQLSLSSNESGQSSDLEELNKNCSSNGEQIKKDSCEQSDEPQITTRNSNPSHQEQSTRREDMLQDLSSKLLRAYNWAQGQITPESVALQSVESTQNKLLDAGFSPGCGKLSKKVMQMFPIAPVLRSETVTLTKKDQSDGIHTIRNSFNPTLVNEHAILHEAKKTRDEVGSVGSCSFEKDQYGKPKHPTDNDFFLSKSAGIEQNEKIANSRNTAEEYSTKENFETPEGFDFHVKDNRKFIEDGQSESYGHLSKLEYTDSDQLLPVHSDLSYPGYGIFGFSTPSQMLREDHAHLYHSDKSPGYGAFAYSTPSDLCRRQEQRSTARGAGYGVFDYSTPSQLFHRGENTKADSEPGYGTFVHSAPSELLRRNEQRMMTDRGPGYGELDYSPPSTIFRKEKERKLQEKKLEKHSPGYGELEYTTPSGLLKRGIHRTEVDRASPGYGELEYTTPSRLLKRNKEQFEGEERSPGYGGFDYDTPSKLLKMEQKQSLDESTSPGFSREQEHLGSDSRAPGCGAFEYSTPSILFKQDQEHSAGEVRSPGYGAFEYSTPSVMFTKRWKEANDHSPDYRLFQYETPSQILKTIKIRNNEGVISPRYGSYSFSSPSELFRREKAREVMDSITPGYRSFSYSTPSGFLEQEKDESTSDQQSPGYGMVEYTLTSKIFRKQVDKKHAESVTPGYAAFEYSSPSELLDRRVKREMIEKHCPGYGSIDYHRPSNLMRHSQNGASHPNLHGYAAFEHSTPSVLLKKYNEQLIEEQQSQGYGGLEKSSPSKLLKTAEKVEQRQCSSPSGLQHENGSMERCRNEEKSLDGVTDEIPTKHMVSTFKYATPSQILKQVTDRSGYGAFDYKTPSEHLRRSSLEEKVNEQSPGYGAFDYKTPSEHLQESSLKDKVEERTSDTPSVRCAIDLIGKQNNLGFETQSDITNYFINLADEMRKTASCLMTSESEPAIFQRLKESQHGTGSVERESSDSRELATTDDSTQCLDSSSEIISQHLAHGNGREQFLSLTSTEESLIPTTYQSSSDDQLSSTRMDQSSDNNIPSRGIVHQSQVLQQAEDELKSKTRPAVSEKLAEVSVKYDVGQQAVTCTDSEGQVANATESVHIHELPSISTSDGLTEQAEDELNSKVRPDAFDKLADVTAKYDVDQQAVTCTDSEGQVANATESVHIHELPSISTSDGLTEQAEDELNSKVRPDAFDKLADVTAKYDVDQQTVSCTDSEGPVADATESIHIHELPSTSTSDGLTEQAEDELNSKVRPDVFDKLAEVSAKYDVDQQAVSCTDSEGPVADATESVHIHELPSTSTSDGLKEQAEDELISKVRPDAFDKLAEVTAKYDVDQQTVSCTDSEGPVADATESVHIHEQPSISTSDGLADTSYDLEIQAQVLTQMKSMPVHALGHQRASNIEQGSREDPIQMEAVDKTEALDPDESASQLTGSFRRHSVTWSDISSIAAPDENIDTVTKHSGDGETLAKCSPSFEVLEFVTKDTRDVSDDTVIESPQRIDAEIQSMQELQDTDVATRISFDFSLASGDTSSIDGLLPCSDSDNSSIDFLLPASEDMVATSSIAETDKSVSECDRNIDSVSSDISSKAQPGNITENDSRIEISKSVDEDKSRENKHFSESSIRKATSSEHNIDSAYSSVVSDLSSRRTFSIPSFSDFDSNLTSLSDISPSSRRSSKFGLKSTESIHMTRNLSFITWSDTIMDEESEANGIEEMGISDQPPASDMSLDMSNVKVLHEVSDTVLDQLSQEKKQSKVISLDMSNVRPLHEVSEPAFDVKELSKDIAPSDVSGLHVSAPSLDTSSIKQLHKASDRAVSADELTLNRKFSVDKGTITEELPDLSKLESIGGLSTTSLNDLFWSMYLLWPHRAEKELGEGLLSGKRSVDSYVGVSDSSTQKAEESGRKYSYPASSTSIETRGSTVEKELMDSQNRKLHAEISTLQTENKLLKEKYNRAAAKISELEHHLASISVQSSVHGTKTDSNNDFYISTQNSLFNQNVEFLQGRVEEFSRHNDELKSQVCCLERELDKAHSEASTSRESQEKTKTVEAYQQEVYSVKVELQQVKSLLEQSEKHVVEEEERCQQAQQQVLQLTEIYRLARQQLETGVVGDTQIKSLEKRLKVTEDRLHHERADRANNLSQVEEKLLSENARLQSVEKELNRQLQREKDRCRSFEQRIKDSKDENDKLRMSLPFDEATLLSPHVGYDIPYGIHGSHRLESRRFYGDYKYIMSQVEKQDGLKSGQEKDIICELWSKKQHACHQLQELELLLQDLDLTDNNITHGLKILREERSQCEATVSQIEEKLQDAHQNRITIESTYKEQLADLVREKHEAAAQLKSIEDLNEAIRSENQILKQAVVGMPNTISATQTIGRDSGIEMFSIEIKNMENKIAQLKRKNNLLEGEVTSLTSQLEARTKALDAVQSEVELINKRVVRDDTQNKKQQKIDELKSEVDALCSELKVTKDKLNAILSEKSQMERYPQFTSRVKDHVANENVPFTYSHPVSTESALRSSVDIKQISGLENEVSDREQEILHLTHQNHECQQQLQQIEHDLNLEHARSVDFEAKVESLQQQLNQKIQMLDAVGGQEKEQLAQFQVFRNTLDSLGQELSQTHAKLKVAQTGLSQERDRAGRYRSEVDNLKRQSGRSTDAIPSENFSVQTQQIKELELEREQIKEELLQANMNIEEETDKLVTCQKEMKRLKEDLATEKSSLLQVAAEKGELEQQLEELAEEHDAAIQEKSQTEGDLVKLEYKLRAVLHQVELEAKQQQSPLEDYQRDMSPEMRKMTSEIETLKVVISGKDKELEIAQDKINGHSLKVDLLLRRVELLHKENHYNHEDITRLTGELALKVKESVANREVNQFLVSERAKLQKDNYQLEKDVEKEKSVAEQRKQDVGDLARKIDISVDHQKSVEKNATEKDNLIVSIESELMQANHIVAQLEMERDQQKAKLEQTNCDLQNISTKNDALEKQLDVHRESLTAEKSVVVKLQDDLISSKEKVENLKQEKSALISGLTSERQATEKFKDDLQSREVECDRLREEIHQLEQGQQQKQEQISTHLETIDQIKKDKSVIYQEYESLCRRLSEKETKISEMQLNCDKSKDELQKDYLLRQSSLEKEKSTSNKELEFARAEITDLNGRIHQLDIQIATFGRTLQELEVTKRQKTGVEAQLQLLESSSGDMRVLMEAHRHEIRSLQETNTSVQDRAVKEEATNIALREEQRLQNENANKETQDLKELVNNLKNQHDGEKRYLQEAKDNAESRIHVIETSLGSAVETRDKQLVSIRLLEKKEEDRNRQHQGEAMAHKLAVEKAETFRSQLEETRKEKWTTDDKLTKCEATIIKQKDELKTAKDKIKHFTEKCHELEAVSYSYESSAKSNQEQMDVITVENKKLRQLLDNQKQHLGCRLKKATTDFKQQLHTSSEDHTKLSQQVQQLTSNLEKAREQISEKSLENLKLQEDMLSLEDKARECSIRLREAQESLRMENELQINLKSRYEDQEDELKTLKVFLSKKAEEAGDADKSTWNEMSRLIQDLGNSMQSHFDSQKSLDQDGKERESQLSRYRSRLGEVESELSTEKALHQITRNSMQTLEEDCQRLRHQLHSLRRRETTTSDKKNKSRMEAINEIIARSQSQAQSMLASTGYYDGAASPIQGLISPRGRVHYSPDNSFGSDSMSPMRIQGYIPTTPPSRPPP